MTSTVYTNTFMQKHDSEKNYRGWACLSVEGRIERPFTNRGGIVATDMKDIDE